jgi:calcium-dependent protein kinase
MELCEGGELFDRIIDHGYMSERQSSIIIAQTSSALAYAHGRGIAHRDIKPENIVFCSKDRQDFRIKLIDWGLAFYYEKDGKMNQAVGSMTYAAPEVIASQDKYTYSQACDIWSLGVLTYVMLCGKPPFWGNRKQLHANASKEKYPFKGDPWDNMNPQAKDFIAKLLKADPKKRPLCSALVQHPWVVTPPPEVPGEQQTSVLSNLKAFAAKSTFSRICITAVARQLDHSHLKDIHAVFRQMDADGNGVLTADEVKKGLHLLGISSSDMPDIDKLFINMDMDGSNSIDYTEFCAAALGEKMTQQNDVIWAAFKTFDTDNSGFVSVDNLKQILDSSDVKDMWSADVCQEVGNEVVSKFDADADGQISFEEWKALMEKCWTKKSPQDRSVGAMDLMQQVSDLK